MLEQAIEEIAVTSNAAEKSVESKELTGQASDKSAPVQNGEANATIVADTQEVVDMGPWNLPKFVVKKKLHRTSNKMDNDAKNKQASSRNTEEISGSRFHILDENEEKEASKGKMTANEEEVKICDKEGIVPPKPKVRNQNGGKNPQSGARGFKYNAIGKPKETKNQGNLNTKNAKPKGPGGQSQGIDKKNIPSTSTPPNESTKRKNNTVSAKDEQRVQELMKRIIKKKGVDFLEKWADSDPLRDALGIIDENDLAFAKALQEKSVTASLKQRGDNNTNNDILMESASAQQDAIPMDILGVVNTPQTQSF